jgi:hypothetical protein
MFAGASEVFGPFLNKVFRKFASLPSPTQVGGIRKLFVRMNLRATPPQMGRDETGSN